MQVRQMVGISRPMSILSSVASFHDPEAFGAGISFGWERLSRKPISIGKYDPSSLYELQTFRFSVWTLLFHKKKTAGQVAFSASLQPAGNGHSMGSEFTTVPDPGFRFV